MAINYEKLDEAIESIMHTDKDVDMRLVSNFEEFSYFQEQVFFCENCELWLHKEEQSDDFKFCHSCYDEQMGKESKLDVELIANSVMTQNPMAILDKKFNPALVGTALNSMGNRIAIYDINIFIELIMETEKLEYREAFDEFNSRLTDYKTFMESDAPIFIEHSRFRR